MSLPASSGRRRRRPTASVAAGGERPVAQRDLKELRDQEQRAERAGRPEEGRRVARGERPGAEQAQRQHRRARAQLADDESSREQGAERQRRHDLDAAPAGGRGPTRRKAALVRSTRPRRSSGPPGPSELVSGREARSHADVEARPVAAPWSLVFGDFRRFLARGLASRLCLARLRRPGDLRHAGENLAPRGGVVPASPWQSPGLSSPPFGRSLSESARR
jgi:hypothetical protein